MHREIHIPFTRVRIGRFIFLLISIVLMFTLRPFLEGFVTISVVVDIFATLILISGVYAASSNKYVFYIALLIALPTLIAHWATYFTEASFLIKAVQISGGLFYIFLVAVILNYLFKEKQITADVIASAICAYLLLGLAWSAVFSILELQQSGSFNIPQSLQAESSPFNYYSYVTLTTLGYGDMTPVTAEARSLSLLEAITGQLYLATLIARLVAINIVQSIEKPSP